MLQQVTKERQRLLVIDRDPSTASLVQLLLGKEYEVEGALSGALAMSLLKHKPFDCVLASLEMPRSSGFHGPSILKKLASFNPEQPIPVVTLASEGVASVLKRRVGGVHLVKHSDRPFSRSELEKALTRARGQQVRLAA